MVHYECFCAALEEIWKQYIGFLSFERNNLFNQIKAAICSCSITDLFYLHYQQICIVLGHFGLLQGQFGRGKFVSLILCKLLETIFHNKTLLAETHWPFCDILFLANPCPPSILTFSILTSDEGNFQTLIGWWLQRHQRKFLQLHL